MPETRAAETDATDLAQRAAEEHLAACEEAMMEGRSGPAVDAYDGCTTCDVRETLAVVWPIILADAAGMLELAGETKAAALVLAEAERMEPRPMVAAEDDVPIDDGPDLSDYCANDHHTGCGGCDCLCHEPLGPNSGQCPVCGRLVATPLLEGHLRRHELADTPGNPDAA